MIHVVLQQPVLGLLGVVTGYRTREHRRRVGIE